MKDGPIPQVSGQEPLVSPRHYVALCAVYAKKVIPYQHLSKYLDVSDKCSQIFTKLTVCQNWYPELINNVHKHAHACVHAQCVKTSM